MAPERCIHNVEDLRSFIDSPTCSEFLKFISEVGEAVKGNKVVRSSSKIYLESKNGDKNSTYTVLALLEKLEDSVEKYPPVQQSSRFGNLAYRSWHENIILKNGLDDMLALVTAHGEASGVAKENLAVELLAYWKQSYGEPARLDYGTGHEAMFLVWLFVLNKVVGLKDLTEVGMILFPKYIDVVRKIQLTYRLEPAGSHGVWSLDDYQFIPFVLGSAQFSAGGRAMISPKAVTDSYMVEDLSGQYLYFSAIQYIMKVKTGPFSEHSPMLYEISNIRKWGDIYNGMLYMFKAEVLGKFPVVQHFVFGDHFPATWQTSGSGAVKASPFISAQQQQSVVPGRPGGTDALTKYFVSSRPDRRGLQSGMPTAFPRPVMAPVSNSNAFTLLDDNKGISIGDWVFEINNTRIASESEMDQVKIERPELNFPFPEMLFSSNYLRCRNEKSNIEINFNAADALHGCIIQRDKNGEPDRNMFKVKMHSKWANRTDANGAKIEQWRDDFDWTYTTTYSATIESIKGGNGRSSPFSRELTGDQIDYEMLKRKDPILWFGNTQLFEDDLFDNGDSSYKVKVRVMPGCFFILGRMWLRVDETYLRIFDTRVFHVFGTKDVLIEHMQQEAGIDELRMSNKEDLLLDHRNCKTPEQVDKKLPVVRKVTEKVSF